jgi:glucose-1-phosphate thymidylyltransferase
VHGPAYIGKNVYISKNASVEHYVSVEQDSRIVSGTDTRSLVLDGSELDLNKARLVDSVVGSRSIVRSSREIYGDIRLIMSDYSKVIL